MIWKRNGPGCTGAALAPLLRDQGRLRLVALYAEDARHFSPKLRALRPDSGGCIQGRAALRDWWADAFVRIPQLKYRETRITAQAGRVVLEYVRSAPGETDLPVAEVFEVKDGLIAESRVYHG